MFFPVISLTSEPFKSSPHFLWPFFPTSQWEGIGPPENEGGEKPESQKMQQNMQRVQT